MGKEEGARKGEQLWVFVYYDERLFAQFVQKSEARATDPFQDPLTRLFSRAYFELELTRLDVPRQLPLSLIMADMNAFKLVNDLLGHRYGDVLLQKVAAKLRETYRREDIVARLGGDEFVILLPKTSYEEAVHLARRFPPFLEFPSKLGPFPVSLAFGVATKTAPHQDVWGVLQEAEEAMYREKIAGRRDLERRIVTLLREYLEKEVYPLEPRMGAFAKFALALKLARALSFSEEENERFLRLLLFHDVGKVALPVELLKKPAAELHPAEWTVVRSHSEVGYRIASQLGELMPVAGEILSFRERWDGKGYPRGLRGRDIPFLSRAGALLSAYEALTLGRPYRPPLPLPLALREIEKELGKRFDPEVGRVFLQIVQ
ncbi:diguanylate cyclase [Candidatus Caldatribacterium sp. SIUC1]|uniref:diguanylate cyclase n=1 Tax=Candidatus Caldatribacterium sp. SIUC1 TaxID=3418365 RepID=UPI003F68F0EC